MKARFTIGEGKEIIEGEFCSASGKTGIPEGRGVFRTIDGKEYYQEQVTPL